ncbi:4'-phosphopantetheinyl transferase family protein [Streptomyces lasalocidi]
MRRQRIGVDVEGLGREPRALETILTTFAPEEQRWAAEAPPGRERERRVLRLWTLKEAYSKARGLGLGLPFDEFSFSLADDRGCSASGRPPTTWPRAGGSWNWSRCPTCWSRWPSPRGNCPSRTWSCTRASPGPGPPRMSSPCRLPWARRGTDGHTGMNGMAGNECARRQVIRRFRSRSGTESSFPVLVRVFLSGSGVPRNTALRVPLEDRYRKSLGGHGRG